MEEEYDIEKILNMFEEDFVIPASKMQRPQSALDREMYEDFNKRNPQADGGRTGFLSGGDVEKIVDIYNAGLEGGYRTSADFIAEQLGKEPGKVSKDIVGRKINELIEDGTLTKQKELETTTTKGKRKIYKVARPIETRDRKLNPDIPKDAKYKMQVPAGKFRGEDSSTTIIYDTTKEKLNERLKKIESDVYVKPSKPKELIPDDKFLVKKSNPERVKENIVKIEYEEVLGKKNQPNTFKPTGKTVVRYKPFIGKDKITIPGQGAKTLKEAEEFVKDYFKANPKKIRVRDPEKDYRTKDIRRQFEKDLQGRTIKFGAKKGYTAHHMLPLAGKADVTDSDIAIISNKMNAELAQFDKPMNALVNEAYALDFSKEGSLKRMNEINQELADIVANAEKKLPKKYKGLIGFNKLTPVLDTFDAKGNQVFDVEVIGADYKKSIGGKKTGTPLRDIETKNIRQMVSEAPTFRANPFFDPSLMGKVIGDMASSLGSPTAIIGLNTAFGVDPRSSLDRAILGTEAALAPAGIKALTSRLDAIKNPTVRKGIETLAGLRLPGVFTPANVMRAARFASPLGIATLAGEGLYQLGKLGYKEQQMINEMRENDPEAYQRYLAEQQELMDVSA